MVVPPSPPTAAVPQTAVQQAKKRSKLPLILGILFVLLLMAAGGGVAGYFFVLKPMLDKQRVVLFEPRPQPTPAVATTPDIGTKADAPKTEAPPYSAPADAVQFVNSNANLTGRLAEHYVDFSFYYPNRWRKDAEAGTSSSTNFAKVQRELAADAPQEIFAIGWYDSTGAKDTDELSYPRLVAERSKQFAKTYPEYEKVSEGPAKAGPYNSYEFRFKGVYRHTDRGDVQIWGRVMFVPPVEGIRGVTLLMLASSLAPEVKSVDDVGVKGELPMMLESFRFGK
jgi:flagellar basal body-associated protein FliL